MEHIFEASKYRENFLLSCWETLWHWNLTKIFLGRNQFDSGGYYQILRISLGPREIPLSSLDSPLSRTTRSWKTTSNPHIFLRTHQYYINSSNNDIVTRCRIRQWSPIIFYSIFQMNILHRISNTWRQVKYSISIKLKREKHKNITWITGKSQYKRHTI